MIKRGFFYVLLGISLTGCKVKQRVSYAERNKQENKAADPKPISQKYDDNGYYTLPEDSGEFIRFQINSEQEYIETFAEIAQMEMKAYGIPASITLAQGLLESGLGRGALALKTNNHFGIKCHTGWEGDRDFHDDDAAGECFRKYNHPMYSYRDHSIFLTSRSRYASLFELDSDDYKRWARGLKAAGYATDSHYPHKLIALIERHQLYKYDQAVTRQGYVSNNTVTPQTSPQSMTYVVKEGDTLYSISRRYLVSVDELMKMNRIQGSIISVGQELTVRSRR